MKKKLGLAMMSVLLVGCSSQICQEEGAIGAGQPGSQADLENNVSSRVYFKYDQPRPGQKGLDPMNKEIVQKQAEWFKRYPENNVYVEGHCDERGTAEYNIALGERRADAVKSAMIESGVDSSKIEARSFGKERLALPAGSAPGMSEAERHARNRRGETYVKPAGEIAAPAA